MIGLLITGHANFGSGITSSVDLVAGEQEDFCYVDFLPTYSLEDLSRELNKGFEELKHCEHILVFADLVGGTPFRTAVEVGYPRGNVTVIGGANLPMLLDAAMTRRMVDDVDELVKAALETGKEQMLPYEFQQVEQTESEDGI